VCRKVENIREKLKKDEDGVPAVTLSIGAAFSGREDSTGNIAKDADLALYEVKKKGKGQMLFYEGTV
ncbi:MAG: GGDEF domain-containing protein, partial [Erysipelotrichaceae bacterium]|nr:GGDEF domain-containing protein [Erysipelotrichaceae bacterium]